MPSLMEDLGTALQKVGTFEPKNEKEKEDLAEISTNLLMMIGFAKGKQESELPEHFIVNCDDLIAEIEALSADIE